MMKVRFWGVRGSVPTPHPRNMKFGGNTSCVEVQTAGGEVVMFDAGSGIRLLGAQLAKKQHGGPLVVHLFLTHFHWDHIQGLPFFAPLYSPATTLMIYSSSYSAPLRQALSGTMATPYYPVPFESLRSRIHLVELDSGVVKVGSLQVRPFQVDHPQGACGYRAEGSGGVLLYAPDREHGSEKLDRLVREQALGADVLIHDSQYTPEEYETRRGWGHCTWVEAVRVAQDAKVKKLILFHHDPAHSDHVIAGLVEKARLQCPSTWAAKEGWTVEI